jgi:hypothetical protein
VIVEKTGNPQFSNVEEFSDGDSERSKEKKSKRGWTI